MRGQGAAPRGVSTFAVVRRCRTGVPPSRHCLLTATILVGALTLFGGCTSRNLAYGSGSLSGDGGGAGGGATGGGAGGAGGSGGSADAGSGGTGGMAADANMTDLPADQADAPGTSSLVGWWKLDERTTTTDGGTSATTVIDSSRFGHHGTLDGLDPATSWVAGRQGGGALSVPPGRLGGVQIPLSSTLSALRHITVVAWMKRVPASAAIGIQNTIMSQQDENDPVAETFNLQTIREDLQGYISTSSAGRPPGSPSGLRISGVATREIWTHVAMSYDGTTVRLFRNGAELDSEDLGRAFVPSSKPFYIGLNKNGTVDQAFEGQLDDVALYNRALPASAIMALAGGASPTSF
jgi:hypothetical protein